MLDLNTVQNTARGTLNVQVVIKGNSIYPQLRGTMCLHQTEGGVLATALIYGPPQGEGSYPVGIFGFHIHERKACIGTDRESLVNADGHSNPGDYPHSAHAEDMPPLFGNQGSAYLSSFADRFTVS